MLMDFHIAQVSANDENVDPEKEFGIRVRIDQLTPGVDWPEIAFPFFAPNFFKVPEVGEFVLVALPADLPLGALAGEETAINQFPDQIFYFLRGFDQGEGAPIAELKQNYPRRSGFWLQNGTLILFDDTVGQEQIWIRLTTGKEAIVINNKGITLWSTVKIRLGNGAALQAVHKGTQMNLDLSTFFSSWSAALTTLATGGAATEPFAAAYATTTSTALAILVAALPNWLSIKTFVDV